MPHRTGGNGHRLCYVVSASYTAVAFLRDHMAAALAAGYRVDLVANERDAGFLQRAGLSSVGFHPVAIVRPIAPWRDLRALWQLFALFRHERYAIVHSVSPKAGLLAMLAGWLAGVPHRVHTFTGQVWTTRRGWRRWLLKQADRLIAALTTHALIDSPSQRDFLVAEGVIDNNKAEVIGKGSICGVDGVRFQPDAEARRTLRGELGIPDQALVLLFLGRLNRDKGVIDLAAAFAAIAAHFPGVRLLLVGPDEEGMVARVNVLCADVHDRVLHVDYTHQPERFMAAADIFCLPSYREGFGMVLIEAAAAGLPAVASRIYGITDAVVDGKTGLLHPPGDVPALIEALSRLVADPERRDAMSKQARARVLADFSQAESLRGLLAFYGRMIA